MSAEGVVGLVQRFRRAKAVQQLFPQHGFRHGHQYGGGDAFAGYVANEDAHAGFIPLEAVVEVSAHGFGGPGHGADAVSGPVQRRCFRHKAVLDAPGNVQLHVGFQAFLRERLLTMYANPVRNYLATQ